MNAPKFAPLVIALALPLACAEKGKTAGGKSDWGLIAETRIGERVAATDNGTWLGEQSQSCSHQ